jgi:hypothetical protein
MFTKVLTKDAGASLAALGKSGFLKDAYLAGGTALALHMGHRISVDFDFFTQTKFNPQQVVQQLTTLPMPFQLERTAPGTILGFVGATKFSLFEYTYPLLEKLVSFDGIMLARVSDLAVMKLAAIGDRGTKRDFIDLYFIIEIHKYLSLGAILQLYDKKFAVLHQNKLHLLKALMYFDDAETDHMPEMLYSVSWKEIKRFFQNQVKQLSKELLG